MKQAIHIKNAPKPVGSYSQAILHGNQLFISGQIPMDPFTNELKKGDIEEQTKQVMDNIMALLDAAEMTKDNLVKCSIFLTDIGNFQLVDRVYASYFDQGFPARETVQVVALPKGVDVEISAIAFKE